MSEEPDGEDRYPVVIEIDTRKMGDDGFLPQMDREDPIVILELRNALANRLGLDDFYADSEQGIMPDTVICREGIPPRYLKIYHDEMDPVYEYAESTFTGNPNSIHGPGHWRTVDRIGRMIAEETPGADPVVVRWFAALHDSHREDDSDDMGHGPRSADSVPSLPDSLQQALTHKQMQLLEYAIRHHTDGDISEDPTIGACWDSDRLDLIRCNVTPSSEYMSTDKGKELAESGELWS